MSGVVYGVGVGPGDPELMTLKAMRLISQSPVVAYPVQGGRSEARSIAAAAIAADAVEIPINVPMGAKELAQSGYDQAVAAIVPHLEAGQDVAILCEGDPLFYGSFMHMLERLDGRHPVVVVPGVSSLSACAAAARWPLAGGNQRLAVLSAPSGDDVLRAGIEKADAAVLFKIGKHLPRIRVLLTAMGLARTALYVERATQGGERIAPLSEIRDDESAYFAVLLVRCS